MDTEKVATNPGFIILTRVLMIVASTVGLPVAGWMLMRVVATADDIVLRVGSQANKIELLDQSVKFGFDSAKGDIGQIRGQLLDHEGRIRVIENISRTAGPR